MSPKTAWPSSTRSSRDSWPVQAVAVAVDATVGTVTVTVITAAVAGAETSAPRRASRLPKRPRSDGRQAGHGGRPRATGAGVLRVVRRLPGVRAGDSASVAWARAPWPARLAPSPRRPGLVGRRCRPGGLAVPEAGPARARADRSARRQSREPGSRASNSPSASSSTRGRTGSPGSWRGQAGTRATSDGSCRSRPRVAPTAAPTTTWTRRSRACSRPRATLTVVAEQRSLNGLGQPRALPALGRGPRAVEERRQLLRDLLGSVLDQEVRSLDAASADIPRPRLPDREHVAVEESERPVGSPQH